MADKHSSKKHSAEPFIIAACENINSGIIELVLISANIIYARANQITVRFAVKATRRYRRISVVNMFAQLIVVLSFFKFILAYNGTKGRKLNM